MRETAELASDEDSELTLRDSTTRPDHESAPWDLLEPPDRSVDLPPVKTRSTELPFDQLTWQNFERLVCRLALKNADIEHCARYGKHGQNQGGIDIYGRSSSGRYTCWQTKNRECLTTSDIKEAVDHFLKGQWADRSDRFILCTSALLSDTKLQEAVETQATRLREREIVFEAHDGVRLCESLRPYPDVIDDFFGRQWLVEFLGEDAAATLKRRLTTQAVFRLRTRLAETYRARFQLVDPGLRLDLSERIPRDVRKRYVVPNVDPANPLSEPCREPEAPRDHDVDQDDEAWQFDGYTKLRRPSSVATLPNEQAETPSLPLEDWLTQDARSLLITGAPGSGKSTVLRCLALDLVCKPELFPKVNKRFVSPIPLLIPFALWSRLTAKRERPVGLQEIVRDAFGADVPSKELEDSFIEALFDERLLLLIDGLDEYSDEQAARTTLAAIESFVQNHNVFAIMTARPAGLLRLGLMPGSWKIARLTDLSPSQQRDLATKLLADRGAVSGSVALQVHQFFQQLEGNAQLRALASNPLLLCGLLSVAAHQIILPKTRYQLLEKLIDILLEEHPNRRATAASEVRPRTRVFSTDDVRREALSKLAFEAHAYSTDAGINRGEARSILEDFLKDEAHGPGWSNQDARLGARELVDVNAETSGLLVEVGPMTIGFCHSAFREHLAGLELKSWPLERQVEFVTAHADELRWRGAILTLVQSFRRQTDIERVLEAIAGERVEALSVDRRLLLAECAFASARFSGAVGRRASLDALDRIETGTNEAERLELLSFALDGPRAGPIGKEIIARLDRWWPGTSRWDTSFYRELGKWSPTDDLARTLQRALCSDGNQMAAAASLANAFGGDPDVGNDLVTLVYDSTNPWVTAAALDALSRGWPSTDGLDDWLHDAERSPSVQLRSVGAIGLYRRGRRGDEQRDPLLRALGTWNSFGYDQHEEITEALVEGWADDRELQDACWASIGALGPSPYDIASDHARSILIRLHREDSRVPSWIQQQIESRDHFAVTMGLDVRPLESVFAEHANVRTAMEAWFRARTSSGLHYDEAQLAAVLKGDTAKQTMLKRLDGSKQFRFWPVWSLLEGWGMDDEEVASVLTPLARLEPEDRQHIAHHIPAIIQSCDESFQLLMEICDLPKVLRPDFVIKGFAALPDGIEDAQAVSAVLPHVKVQTALWTGDGALIRRFHADSRVKEFALRRLREPSPPLAEMASAYSGDPEVGSLVLQRAGPLPTVLRRCIARRATQRIDDEALTRVLRQCDLEPDENAMAQATIGLSYAVLASPSECENRTKILNRQLHATGPDMDERRVAAFGGLLALDRIDIFADARARSDDKPLEIELCRQFKDYAPVVALAAERWEELEIAVEERLVGRLNKWSVDPAPAQLWRSFAPHLGRSSQLRAAFLEYCDDRSVRLDTTALLALSRLSPGSSLLLDCCVRILTGRDEDWGSPLDVARATVVASKCLANSFYEDSEAVAALVQASDEGRANGGALVGLASRWPDHEIVNRKYRKHGASKYWPGVLPCAALWLVSAQGPSKRFVDAFSRFVTRDNASPWDFPEDASAAFRARLKRDSRARKAIRRLALNHDEPSIRASTVRLLADVSPAVTPDLTRELLGVESARKGPPRFALDVLTNRIRPAKQLLSEALGGILH